MKSWAPARIPPPRLRRERQISMRTMVSGRLFRTTRSRSTARAGHPQVRQDRIEGPFRARIWSPSAADVALSTEGRRARTSRRSCAASRSSSTTSIVAGLARRLRHRGRGEGARPCLALSRSSRFPPMPWASRWLTRASPVPSVPWSSRRAGRAGPAPRRAIRDHHPIPRATSSPRRRRSKAGVCRPKASLRWNSS